MDNLVTVAGPGAVGDGFERERLAVSRVEGELTGGQAGWAKSVGAHIAEG
ncbi:hypothetical protein [Streptomyces acidiscabies]|uniref:Uncharacterized protein n=1 Tax=Streptomyces acidiscabies TaxID=42234 RepID=A0ABU4MC04_9ACTN|nr:hypothetical protein [Streptomyces acidiscabies]MDX3025646.1 hypothetical protein [Streptomyces acidiscabies]